MLLQELNDNKHTRFKIDSLKLKEELIIQILYREVWRMDRTDRAESYCLLTIVSARGGEYYLKSTTGFKGYNILFQRRGNTLKICNRNNLIKRFVKIHP